MDKKEKLFSLKKIIWKPKEYDNNFIEQISNKVQINKILSHLISTRIKSLDDLTDFLNPKLNRLLPNPFILLDMQKATNRTKSSLLNDEKICIFADYDVDGATSGALLKNFFHDLNKEILLYVPDRLKEGYGPSINAIKKIHAEGVKLLIILDCGTLAYEALEYAEEIGLDIIVIDHHIANKKLPPAIAIINPNRLDENNEYTYLAAVGVSFLFCVALLSELKNENFFFKIKEPNLLQYLDLVGLGTICDVMPVIKLNRAFVAQGLKVINQKYNLGINALYSTIINNNTKKVTTYDLGFLLGPRINAGGRVGESDLGLRLLSTNSYDEAKNLALKLERYNHDRRILEYEILKEALEIAELQKDRFLIFVIGKNWHPGIIGIIAGKLKEEYNKPVAVVALNDGIGKGSCRSIKGIDFGVRILDAKSNGIILSGGGHSMAGGFTVLESHLLDLENFLRNSFEEELINNNSFLEKEYDLDLSLNDINFSLIEEIEKLEPFGVNNLEPLFKFYNLCVLNYKVISNKHISCVVTNNNAINSCKYEAIAFFAFNRPIGDFLMNKKHIFDLIGTIKKITWKNSNYCQIQIKDLISK